MYFDIHTHTLKPESIYSAIFPEQVPENSPYSYGIHPMCFNDSDVALEKLCKACSSNGCVAVGECGLDKRSEASYEQQRGLLLHHIALSERLQKPLVIHNVGFLSEVIAFKNELKPSQKWILHGFRKGRQAALESIRHGLMLSFGEHLPHYLGELPLDTIFFETDDSMQYIADIYTRAASILGTDSETLEQKIRENAVRTFGIFP